MELRQNTILKNGEYSIVSTLGQGGFGITYLANQVRLNNRKVVIKEFFIKEYCDRERDTMCVTLGTSGSHDIVVRFLDKFHKEALNIAALNHPNIVRIIDVFEENNTAYYVMEYHSRGSLASFIDAKGAMCKNDALRYVRQVASALSYIHSRRMMHLDIKPDNILIDQESNAVLIDFGLAKVYEENATAKNNRPRTSSIASYSPGYAPIEQYNPSGIATFSPSTDIYSLGATLFTLLTGECPPLAMELVNSETLIDDLERCSVDKHIIDTIVKSMSFVKENRPQNIGEFLSLLDAQPAGSRSRVTEPMKNSGVSRPTQPKVKSGGVSRPTEPMNNNNGGVVSDNNYSATTNKEPKKPFNWKQPVAILAAILCVLFAGVGIKECNDYRAEQQRLAAVEQARQDAIAAYNDSIAAADRKRNIFETKTFTVKGIDFTMVAVGGGTFNMGSNDGDSDEKPVHSVTLSDYYIGETEVTQELWQAVMGSNPSYFKGDKNPVECVSYKDCEKFIDKLNDLLAGQLPDGRKFRLPSEAQWEFAARGGNKGKNNNHKFSGNDNIDAVAWYYDNSGDKTHPVKQKKYNELGLYDMSGNVWEWCIDWYDSSYYSSSPLTNPEGPQVDKTYRVLRGGSWINIAHRCRVARRSNNTPVHRGNLSGLRLAF